MPLGASEAVSGLSTGEYIVSPTANTPKVVTKRAAAISGRNCAKERMSQSEHPDRANGHQERRALRRAIARTTTTWSSTMMIEFTAAAVPIAVESTSSTVIAYAGRPASNWA